MSASMGKHSSAKACRSAFNGVEIVCSTEYVLSIITATRSGEEPLLVLDLEQEGSDDRWSSEFPASCTFCPAVGMPLQPH